MDIHNFAKEGNLSGVKKCIEQGVSIEHKDNYGCTPLLWASFKGYINIVQYLVEYGADIECKNNDGNTPLLRATWRGHINIVQYLVEHGVDIECKNNEGYTPLLWASYNGNINIVQYLVEHGANIECINNYGDTTLSLASYRGYINIVQYLVGLCAIYDESKYDYKKYETNISRYLKGDTNVELTMDDYSYCNYYLVRQLANKGTINEEAIKWLCNIDANIVKILKKNTIVPLRNLSLYYLREDAKGGKKYDLSKLLKHIMEEIKNQ